MMKIYSEYITAKYLLYAPKIFAIVLHVIDLEYLVFGRKTSRDQIEK